MVITLASHAWNRGLSPLFGRMYYFCMTFWWDKTSDYVAYPSLHIVTIWEFSSSNSFSRFFYLPMVCSYLSSQPPPLPLAFIFHARELDVDYGKTMVVVTDLQGGEVIHILSLPSHIIIWYNIVYGSFFTQRNPLVVTIGWTHEIVSRHGVSWVMGGHGLAGKRQETSHIQ